MSMKKGGYIFTMKWIQRFAVVSMLGSLLVAAGCSSSSSPKETIVDALSKEMTSYAFNGTVGFDNVEIPAGAAADEAEALGVSTVAGMLKGAKMTFDGQYDKDAKRIDVTLKLEWTAEGTATTVEVPIIATEEKVYVKVPNLPFLPLPEELTKNYLEFDMKELAEQSGVDAADLNFFADNEKYVKLGKDIVNTIVTPFEEKDYFFAPKADEVQGLPEGAKYDDLVQFKITDETFEPALEVIVNKVAPAIIDLLSKEEDYLKQLDLTKEDLETAKKELADNGSEAIKEAKKAVKINELALTGGVNDGFMEFQGVDINIDITTEGSDAANIDLYVRSEYKDINKKQTFEQEIPTETTTLEELEEVFGGMFGETLE